MITFYIISIIITFAVTFSEYLREKHQYKFTLREKLLGLVLVPLVPGLNLVVAYVMLRDYLKSRS